MVLSRKRCRLLPLTISCFFPARASFFCFCECALSNHSSCARYKDTPLQRTLQSCKGLRALCVSHKLSQLRHKRHKLHFPKGVRASCVAFSPKSLFVEPLFCSIPSLFVSFSHLYLLPAKFCKVAQDDSALMGRFGADGCCFTWRKQSSSWGGPQLTFFLESLKSRCRFTSERRAVLA